jgi:hypothetical protein
MIFGRFARTVRRMLNVRTTWKPRESARAYG